MPNQTRLEGLVAVNLSLMSIIIGILLGIFVWPRIQASLR